MKAIILLILFSTTTSFGQSSDNSISVGTSIKMNSKILNEEREIWIHVPKGYSNSIYSSNRYPVVYLLDGNTYFHSVVAMTEELSRNSLCPEMIVVGILNTDRLRDLTPSHSLKTYDGKTNTGSTSGGADNFTEFLEKELIPYLDSTYPTTPHRMLIGHSFGGLMVLNAMLNHGHLFNSYVSIDPSLWWDDQKLLSQANSSLKNQLVLKTLYLGIANQMEVEDDVAQIRKDTSGTSLHTRSIFELTDKLSANPDNGLRWSYRYYKDDDHGSVPLIATYDALRFIFNYYKFKGQYNDTTLLISHYENVSGQIGYKILPPESTTNSVGYYYLQRKQFEKAHAFFKLNIENYPNSFNPYDSMGEYYEIIGDNKRAIEYYTLALNIKEFSYTRKKLEKLKSENE